PVRDRPDDVLGPECRVTSKKYVRQRRLHRHLVHHRHVPLVELDADIAFDPGERILLSDGDQHVVALEMLVGFPCRHQIAAALLVIAGFHFFEGDAGEPAALVGERLGHKIVEYGYVLVGRVLLFPRRRLHLLEPRAHYDLDVNATEAPRRAAAVHGRVAAAENDHPLADLVDVTKRYG